jgi:hypothetical protein
MILSLAVKETVPVVGHIWRVSFLTLGAFVGFRKLGPSAAQSSAFTGERALIGKSIETCWRGSHLPSLPASFMISSQTCSACSVAKVHIGTQPNHIVEVPACTGSSSVDCFDDSDEPIPTPTFIIVDQHGTIREQFTGWPTSRGEQNQMLKQLEDIK